MNDPKHLPPWTLEGPAQQVRDDPEQYEPGSSPLPRPIEKTIVNGEEHEVA